MTYTSIRYTITPFSEDIADILIDALNAIGYEGFEYTPTGINAFIATDKFDAKSVDTIEIPDYIREHYAIDYTVENIPDRNWNKEWEDHFTPVVIDGKIIIRAGFHPTIPGIEYDIIIEPKMSFGTGHHPTTALMLRSIMEQAGELRGRKVLDMGCGTGILAIMASKTGADSILGIDIDNWAYNNAMENMDNNRIGNIRIEIGDASLLEHEGMFHVILANINRNILLEDMKRYVCHLEPNGLLIISGFYTHELPLLQQEAERLGLTYKSHKSQEAPSSNWSAATFKRRS